MSASATEKAAITALWGGLRVVVIDLETTSTQDGGPQRAVSVAAVTCRLGTVRGKWQTLVNPEIPVAPGSRRIHGITDEHLIGEPVFSEVATTIQALLTENDGERLVLAAHNIPFDVSVLRHEFQRLGLDLPDIQTIDTMGPLAGLVGVRPADRSLRGLLGALDLTNSREHDALADATACAEAVVELLNRAATQGHTDFEELLATISNGSSTHGITAGITLDDSATQTVLLPQEHVSSHTSVLSRRAGAKMLEAWQGQVRECAKLRCRHLDDRVQAALPEPNVLRLDLEAVLDECCENNDTAGAATVLHALVPLLEHLPARNIRLGKRTAILEWAAEWSEKLNAVGRCSGKDLCPKCRSLEPCALDTWFEPLAELALGDSENIRGFFQTTGRAAGTGTYTTWIAKGVDHRLADATMQVCVRYWRSVGQDVRAQQLVSLAWKAGCRHPDLADDYAGQIAAAGRAADLAAGVAVCDDALLVRDGSTHEGWTRVLSRRNQLQGRVERAQVRYTDRLDEDGNPIPLRRHHPQTPRRTTRTRFVQL